MNSQAILGKHIGDGGKTIRGLLGWDVVDVRGIS
jgi:hypothetical protein